MIKNKTKVFHVRHPKEKAVMTVAARVNEDEDVVRFGFAFCSPKDNFSKKVGRTKALGRVDSAGATWTDFNGHSADALCRIWNNGFFSNKPQIWKHTQLVSIEQTGLAVVLEA